MITLSLGRQEGGATALNKVKPESAPRGKGPGGKGQLATWSLSEFSFLWDPRSPLPWGMSGRARFLQISDVSVNKSLPLGFPKA